MHKKANQRADELLGILMKVVRDKVFDHIIMTEKGPSSSRLTEINKRHMTAKEQLESCIVFAKGTGYVVSHNDASYDVCELETPCKCFLK